MHYRMIVIGLATLALCAPAALAKAPHAAAAVKEAPHKADRERAELRGLVNTVLTEQEITATEGDQAQTRRIKISEATYDKAGNLTEDKTYMSSDMVKTRTPQRADASAVTFQSDMGNATEHYKFDAAGNLIEKSTTYGDDANAKPDDIKHYTYDKHGRVSEEDTVDDAGKVLASAIYTRDAKGYVVGEQNVAADAKPPYPTMVYTYEFDKQGNWIKRTQTVTNVAPEDTWQYSESQHGPLVRTLTYYKAPKPPKPKKPKPAAAPVAEQPPATDTSPIIITP
jgi:hypothetical protein